MRKSFKVALVLLGFLLTATASGSESAKAAVERIGNDDLVVALDTSLSMIGKGKGAHNVFPTVQAFIRNIISNYLKVGDRLILITFDNEARLEFSQPNPQSSGPTWTISCKGMKEPLDALFIRE